MSGRRARRRLALGATAAAIALGAAAAAWWWLRSAPPAIDPDDPAQVALGQRVYAESCAQCHGARLEGQPDWRERLPNGRLPAPPHDADGHTWHHPDKVLFDITKFGLTPFAPAGYESDMPAYEGVLTDAEMRAVLAYIKSTWPPQIRERQARIDREAQR